MVPSEMVGWRRVGWVAVEVLEVEEGTALWVRECRAVVVLDLWRPEVEELGGAGALSRDVGGASVDVFEVVDATDCGRDVLSLSMDMGLVPIFERPASAALLAALLVLGALIDVALAIPAFGAALALAVVFPTPISAACALALAASLLSGEGERDVSGVSSCSLSSLVACNGLGSPNIVTGRCLDCGCDGGSSSAGDSAAAVLERVAAPEMVPGGRRRLRRLEASFLGRREGCGRRVGESSILVDVS